jgi:hypothetical protein
MLNIMFSSMFKMFDVVFVSGTKDMYVVLG